MSWFCVQCFAFHRRAELKPACIPLFSSYGYFFYMPRFFNLPSLCRTSFIPVTLHSKNHIANACEWTETCALKTFSEIEGQQAYSRRKEYLDPFSVAQVIIVRGFIFFFFSFFFFLVFFLYANFPFHSLWSRERQLPAVTSKQLFAKQTLMCSFLFFLMIL